MIPAMPVSGSWVDTGDGARNGGR